MRSGSSWSRVLAVVALALATRVAAAEPDTFKVGGILSFSGAYGIIGESMKRGVEIAVAERGGKVLGKRIEILWEDDETKPQVAVQKGTRMLASGVQMFYGAISSSSTLALMKLADQRKIPVLVTASADDRITGADKNRYTFRTSGNSTSENMSVVQFLKKSGYRSIYGVAADYNVMRDGWALTRREAEKIGINVLGEDFPPLGNKDYSVIIDKVRQSGADAVVVEITGNDAVTFVKQAGEVGLNARTKLIGPNLIDELLANAAGAASLGVQSAIRYHFSQDNPRNKKFVEEYRKRYDAWPDPFAGEAYDGMSWWLDTVESTRSWDHDKWVAAFEHGTNKSSVDGAKTMHACDHQATQTGLWAEVVRGTPPLPPFTMKIKDEFPPPAIFPTCD